MRDTFKTATGGLSSIFAILVFFALLVWWIVLHFGIHATSLQFQLWASAYQILAFIGFIFGFRAAMQWGGLKSVLGRAIFAFSFGLLFQCFGQSSYSYYIYYLHQPVPYPSIGDIGFFGSIPCYLYGAIMLAQASGAKFSLKSYRNQLQAVLIPVVLLGISYIFFLQDYVFDFTNPIKIFLDFGYPFGQALYVSVAILAYLLSRKFLGGAMRLPIICFIVALILQYASDFMFLYQSNKGTWYAGGTNDLLYSISYLALTLALVYIGRMFMKIRAT